MAAKHARHDMRKDKNFKGSDPSELTAQSLYCGYVTRADKYDISMDNSMISNAIWEKHARVSFSKTIEDKFEVFENSESVCFSRFHEKQYYYLLQSFQLKCCSNIDSIHYLGLTNSFDQVPRDIHTLPVKEPIPSIWSKCMNISRNLMKWIGQPEVMYWINIWATLQLERQ